MYQTNISWHYRLLFSLVFGALTLIPITGQTRNLNNFGIEYGNLTEKVTEGTETLTTKVRTLGAVFNGLTIRDSNNTGFFVHGSLFYPSSFPTTSTLSDGDTTVEVDLSTLDYMFIYSMILGPGFREVINPNTTIIAGFGVHVMQMLASLETYQTSYFAWGINLGIGAVVDVRYYLTDSLSLVIGLTGTYDFEQYSTGYMNTYFYDGWVQNFSAYSIRPHVMIGIDSINQFGR